MCLYSLDWYRFALHMLSVNNKMILFLDAFNLQIKFYINFYETACKAPVTQ